MSKIRSSKNESLISQGNSYSVFDRCDTLGQVIYFIRGSYHSDQTDYIRSGAKTIYQYMQYAKTKKAKFLFIKPGEPNVLWSFENPLFPREEKFIFDILHEQVANTGISPNDVAFVSGNANIRACYAGYCKWKSIPVHQQIRIKSRAFWVNFTDETHEPPETNYPIAKYCTILNRRWREQKGELLLKLIDTGLMEPEYADRFNKTFNFFRQNPEQNLMLRDNPYMRDYFCDLPGDDDLTQTLSLSNITLTRNHVMDKTVSESAFDFVVDYTMNEDMDPVTFARYKKEFPWWTENIISEKTFRNMLLRKPFLRLGEPHSLQLLREEYGFKTFDGILFDESYDLIEDQHQRIQAMVDQLKFIMDNYTLEQLVEKINSPAVQQVLDYNYSHFKTVVPYLKSGNHPWLETHFVNNMTTHPKQAE